jgi:hypothetical protein
LLSINIGFVAIFIDVIFPASWSGEYFFTFIFSEYFISNFFLCSFRSWIFFNIFFFFSCSFFNFCSCFFAVAFAFPSVAFAFPVAEALVSSAFDSVSLKR